MKKGDIVINSRSDRRGASGLSDRDGSVSLIHIVLKPNLEKINPEFAHHLIRSKGFQEEFYRFGTGIVADLWSTRYERMAQIRVPLPPMETQQRIADYLDRETAEIDAAVADLDKYVELLEKRRRVLISQSVTRGIGSDRTRIDPGTLLGGEGMSHLQDSGAYWLGEIPKDWKMLPAWALFAERKEKCLPGDVHLTPSQTHGVLTQQDYMDRTGNKVVLNLTGADNMKRVRVGDFIIHLRSFEGGIEASAIDGKVSNAYTVLTPASDAHFGYYRWFMKSVPLIEGLASSTDQLRDGQSINFSRFSHLSLPFPPLEVQQRIADYLDRETSEIDSLIAESTRLRDLLLKRRSVLITEVVTGRKQV